MKALRLFADMAAPIGLILVGLWAIIAGISDMIVYG